LRCLDESRIQESGVRSQESGVRSQESGVRSQESGVRSQESGVRSQESGVRSQESGVRSQESGVRSQESGVRSQESGVFSVIDDCKPFRWHSLRAVDPDSTTLHYHHHSHYHSSRIWEIVIYRKGKDIEDFQRQGVQSRFDGAAGELIHHRGKSFVKKQFRLFPIKP
jgi:hypothetical protein